MVVTVVNCATTTVTEPTAAMRAEGGHPISLSTLSQEATSMIFDIERHLDTERDDSVRRQLCDTMWALRWARENLLCLLDYTRVWQSQPSTNDLAARYPHPDQQPK